MQIKGNKIQTVYNQSRLAGTFKLFLIMRKKKEMRFIVQKSVQYFCKAISAVPSSVKTEVFNLHEYANFPTKWTANEKTFDTEIV